MASIQQSIADLCKMMNQILKNQEENKVQRAHMAETLEQIQSSVDELLPVSARAGKQSILEPDNPPTTEIVEQPQNSDRELASVRAGKQPVNETTTAPDSALLATPTDQALSESSKGIIPHSIQPLQLQDVVSSEPNAGANNRVPQVEVPSLFATDSLSISMLNDAEISEESFETKLDVSNTFSDLCPLPVCENAAVYLSSIPLAHKTFNGNWCSMQVFYIAAVYLKPPWEPPDDRTQRKFKFMSVLMSKNDEIKLINKEDLCIGWGKAKAKQGGFGSYLLGLNKRMYELAGVNTEGNVPRSYKEPAFGWMIGFLFVTTFVGLLALVPLRKIMIIDYKLTYPSGTATTVLINSFHTEKGDKMTKKQVKGFVRFFSMSFLGSFFQWFFSGAQSTCGFSLFPTFGLKAFIQTFYFDFSMAYVEDEMKNASMLDGDDLAGVDFDLDIYSDLVLSKPSDVPEEEVSFSHMRNDFSSQSVLNETEVVEWKEIQGIAKSVRVPSCSIRNAHKVFDMLLMVKAESKMFDKGVEVVDYREENGIEIDERACMVLLLALKRADQVDMSLKPFCRMVDANVPITVYSMTIAVDGLGRKGETDPARVLIDEMSCVGFKANAYSYNTLICAYIEKGDFVGMNAMLKLMKRTSALFDEMVGEGLEPTATTLSALINGACKACQVEAADARVEDEADSLPKVFAAAVKARRKDFLVKTKITVCGGGDGSGLEDGDVLVFPDMVIYRGLKESDVEGFVGDVIVRGEPWGARSKEEVTSTYVFVCAHGSRDKRCGVCGPVLLEKLKEEIEARGLSEQVVTSPCSHIGGHRYAGNLIIYGTDPTGNVTGHWYGYVTPDDVAELLDTHIGKGEIIEKPWRGQMGTHEGGQEVEQTLPNGKEKEKKEKKHKEEPKLIEKEAPSSCCQGVNGVSCCKSPEVKSKTVNNKVIALDASGMQIQLYQMKEIGRKQKNDEKEVIEGASCCSSFFPTCDFEDYITAKHLSVKRHLEVRAIIFVTVETHFDLFDTEKKEYELFDTVDMRDDPKSLGKLDCTMQTMEELLEEAIAVSTISVRISKFLIFSSPRPPEGADLEDKINFKEGRMLRAQISQSLGILMQNVEVLTFGYK